MGVIKLQDGESQLAFPLHIRAILPFTFRPTWGEDLVVGLIDKDATSASVCLNDKKLPYSTCY